GAAASAAAEHRAGHDPGFILPRRKHLKLSHSFRARQYGAVGVHQYGIHARRDFHDTGEQRLLGRAVRAGAAYPAPGCGEPAGDVPARLPAARSAAGRGTVGVAPPAEVYRAGAQTDEIFFARLLSDLRAGGAGSELA